MSIAGSWETGASGASIPAGTFAMSSVGSSWATSASFSSTTKSGSAIGASIVGQSWLVASFIIFNSCLALSNPVEIRVISR